ncbi:hypothetical protein DDP54_07665 [Cellulomonas sp. WB94]|uniref:NfeD family protein n=1 Tax=Cellulomonas sp. WB94 TaxID=2173174 RepID=UPI000D58402A|nr:NfeD family protein [Cellulomonas sp. WB94]PVU82901.1 hypothetical protein DDP54_07665 [Cellulomonas sp. WB94]
MTVFMILGGLGLVLLLLSLVVGEVFEEIGFGDGGLSGSSIGIGAVVFGASGVIALSNGLGTGWAYGIAIAFAVVAAGVAQAVITRLARSEDPPPPPLEGAFGVATATTGPEGGEVRLEGVRDLENRLAWSDERIEAGTRVVVLAVSGSRVHVRRA